MTNEKEFIYDMPTSPLKVMPKEKVLEIINEYIENKIQVKEICKKHNLDYPLKPMLPYMITEVECKHCNSRYYRKPVRSSYELGRIKVYPNEYCTCFNCGHTEERNSCDCTGCQKEREEENRRRLLSQESKKEERKNEFTEAIQNKRWIELSQDEFEILEGIVRLKTKSRIYSEIFNGNPNDKKIWKKVNNIEKYGLISVIRENTRVIRFEFHPELEHIFFSEMINSTRNKINALSLSLAKELNIEIEADYSGEFMLEAPVQLEVGVKYIYKGQINTDGSISLKIRPFNNFVENNDYDGFDYKHNYKYFSNEKDNIDNIGNGSDFLDFDFDNEDDSMTPF